MSHSTVKIGKISQSYRGIIPDFYTFFFKKDHYFFKKDAEDPDYYREVGYRTTCGEALALLQSYGYTIEFFSQVYEFFYQDLVAELKVWLGRQIGKQIAEGVDPDSEIDRLVTEYISLHSSKSKTQELLDFVDHIRSLFSSDFIVPPFNRPHRYGPSVQEAAEYFSSISKYGVIAVDELRDYVFAHYQLFPQWILMIWILFDPNYFYAYDEYPEITEFMYIRLLLEASSPKEEFKLEVSEIINDDLQENEDPEEYLQSLHFDLSQNIIRKIGLYNRVFQALFKNEDDLRNQYVKVRCRDLLYSCEQAVSNNEKGRVLEDLTEVLFTSNNYLALVDKRVSTGDEEIDLVIQNNINRPFWIAFHSPLFFVECKNWKNSASAADLRNFEGKLRNHSKLAKIGFFVCLGGFTSEVFSELKRMSRDTQHIVLITKDDIVEYISSNIDFFEWLERRTSNFY